MDTNSKTPINIIMISYYSKDIVEKVIDRINEVTKYPFRLIVGDNLSKNSPEIREMLKTKVGEGKVTKAYFYDDNYMTSIFNHMLGLEMNDAKFSIVTDHDAFIITDTDWLTIFNDTFENDDLVVGMGFRSINGNLSENGKNMDKDVKKKCCVNMVDGRCMFNAHYFAFRNDLLKRYFKTGKPIVDGELRLFTDNIRRSDKKPYKLVRYDEGCVSNLSSDLMGLTKTTEIKSDINYKNMRTKVLHGRVNERGKGFLKLYNIKDFKTYPE